MYCLSKYQAHMPEDKKDLHIKGRFDSEEQGSLKIKIHRCQEGCAKDSVIDQMLQGANIAIYFLDYGIEHNNLNEPLQTNVAGLFTSVSTDNTKTHDLYLKRVVMESDVGFVMADIRNKTKYAMASEKESIGSQKADYFYELNVKLSTISELNTRKYRRLFVVVSELGGYIKAIAILALLYRPFQDRLYYIQMINHMFKVENRRRQNEKALRE